MSSSAAASPRVTAVVVTWRGKDHIEACLLSLLDQDEPAPILVVDNASDDGTREILARFAESAPDLRVLRLDRNAGFAGGMHAAMATVGTEFVALLNDDAVADRGWLGALRRGLDARPDAAAATSRMLLMSDGRINNAGVGLTKAGYGFDIGYGEDPSHCLHAREVFGFSGGAAMIRTRDLQQAGGFPAEFFLYYEDTDTAFRLRLMGHRVLYEPAAEVRHIHSASAGGDRRAFAFHNERNRLWMLMRCAPARVAIGALGRFCLTTASIAARGLAGRRAEGANFQPALRLRVLLTTVRHIPALVRQRRSLPVTARQRRLVWDSSAALSR